MGSTVLCIELSPDWLIRAILLACFVLKKLIRQMHSTFSYLGYKYIFTAANELMVVGIESSTS